MHRIIHFDLNDADAGGIATYPGLQGKKDNFIVLNAFPSCPDSCKRDWSKIRKFRRNCDTLTASTLCVALNALHHEFDVVLGYGGDLPGLCSTNRIGQFIDEHDMYKAYLCRCQIGQYGHAKVLTLALNENIHNRMRFLPCSSSLCTGKVDYSFHESARNKVLEIFSE